ncbi:hypothetical protein VIGAN_01208800, partial [Vigna angularis var. angularis]
VKVKTVISNNFELVLPKLLKKKSSFKSKPNIDVWRFEIANIILTPPPIAFSLLCHHHLHMKQHHQPRGHEENHL